MTLGIRLQVVDTATGTRFERVFASFPVRIGRNPLNDLQLQQRFVSNFHSVIEMRGQSLYVRDLGSRNGTAVAEQRLVAHQPFDLTGAGNSFNINTLKFIASLEQVDPSALPRLRPQGFLSASRAPAAMVATVALDGMLQGGGLAATVAHEGASPSKPPPGKTPAAVAQAQAEYDAYRAAWKALELKLTTQLGRATPTERQLTLEWIRNQWPEVASDSGFGRITNEGGANKRQLEALALRGVNKLASLYLRSAGEITNEDDMIRFFTKLRELLDVFFRSFVPLRDGYRNFANELDLKRDTNSGHAQGMEGAQAVRKARNPDELAAALLNYSDDFVSGHKEVEGFFADLMIHQLALMDGVMRGVKSLIKDLSPAEVEQDLAVRKKEGKAGFLFGPYRFRGLWNSYLRKHADADDGDKRIFSLIFGSGFAKAYSEYTGGAGDEGRTIKPGAVTSKPPIPLAPPSARRSSAHTWD